MKKTYLLLVLTLTSSCSFLTEEPEVEELTLEEAVVVPTDLVKINYPDSYQQPIKKAVRVINPYCAISTETVAYPPSYLGKHALPEINGSPLPSDIKRAVGIKDAWVPDPNFNSCNSPEETDLMFNAFKGTLKRAVALGAQQVHFTNHVSFKEFEDATLDYSTKIPDSMMRMVIETAHLSGLEVVLYINVFLGGERPLDQQNVSGTPLTDEWLTKFISGYEPFLLNQAEIAQESGIKGLMLNNFDYEPSINGHEELYQEKMLGLIQKVRTVYSSEVILYIDPLRTADQSKLEKLLDEVDAYLYTPTTTPLQNQLDKTINIGNLKKSYLLDLENIREEYQRYNKPFYIRILIQSERDFLLEGWREEAFCVRDRDDPCYQEGLTADFSVQAIAYEGLMEALKEAYNDGFLVKAVDTYGYWHTDVILPLSSQPHLGHTIRNKPAESIVRAWFKD